MLDIGLSTSLKNNMYCSSCGKKISSKSNFCKHCGEPQKKKKLKKSQKTDYVWTCDYCQKEFNTKLESDSHEHVCAANPRNKKFPYISSPKKAWTYLWVTTLLVFGSTLYISAKFEDLNVTLLNNEILLIFFFGNILIGIFAFLAIAFSDSKPKGNIISFLIKYAFFLCLGYLVFSPLVFATEGYKAQHNEGYKKRYYTSIVPSPPTATPFPPNYKEQILTAVNKYRQEQKITPLTTDDEFCKIAERYVNKSDLSDESLKNRNDKDLCPKCSEYPLMWVGTNTPDNVVTSWSVGEETKKILTGKYKFGCAAYTNNLVMFALGNKGSTTKTTTTTTSNTATRDNSGNVECIGPDGKHFNTTMAECEKLNKTWGKPVDYMVNCNYPTECGGGTKREPKSVCDKPCTRITNNTNNSGNQVIYVPQNTSNNSSKTAVFLTSSQYTIYCPAQNVGAVMTIDSTMKSKSMEWAKNYNDCADRFRNNDPCWSSCKTAHTNGWNQCSSVYGYSGSEYDACTKKVSDEYSSCISKCPSPSSSCDYVYAEQKNLMSQINNLCK